MQIVPHVRNSPIARLESDFDDSHNDGCVAKSFSEDTQNDFRVAKSFSEDARSGQSAERRPASFSANRAAS